MTDTAQLRALLAKMTPGEWVPAPYSSMVGAPIVASPSGRPVAKVTYFHLGPEFDNHDRESAANAAGIVALVNAAEPMLDELERLRAEVARLRADLRVVSSLSATASPSTTRQQTEQTMAMTITQEQFDTVQRLARRMGGSFVLNEGVTITPAEPPAEMVKLAREIAREAVDGGDLYVRVALAALQHAVDVVKGAHAVAEYGDWRVSRSAILNALGAIGAP